TRAVKAGFGLRVKDMIVTDGENVYSAEVKTAIASPRGGLMRGHRRPDPAWGERVHAVVVLRLDARPAPRRSANSPTGCRSLPPERYSSASCAGHAGTAPTAASIN